MKFPHMIYGGDYNPDQWPQETWLEDARLMREAGVNLVSLGIFAWPKLQPRPDTFDFDWLDGLMDLLHAHSVNVNLATPSASPPAWLVKKHPEILPVTRDGVTLWHGSRRHYCPHSPAYHEHVVALVTQLAKRYAAHPALKMWHVDNEYASAVTECFCERSITAFREWLQAKYTSLEDLNCAWGAAFWGQTYSEWEEIHPPRHAPTFLNPSHQLDWARFNSTSWIECFEKQKAVLRAFTPDVPVTTNFMRFHKPVDYWDFASREDVVSDDHYPDTHHPEWMLESAMACDLMRSLGDRRPWILMEQATGNVNWRPRNTTKRPGVMRLCNYQAIGRGADGVMFFQWRASKSGAEKHHSGMLPHIGTDSRIWREVKALGQELPKLNAILASEVRADIAFLIDWESWWALEFDGKPSSDVRQMKQIEAYYRPFFERNLTVDFAHPGADLSRYQLVVAPNLYLVNARSADNINRYVQEGGALVMSFFSGIVDQNEHIHLGGYPAPFREMLGLVVEEYAAYNETQRNGLCTEDGRRFETSLWNDVIRLEGAQALATFESDYFAGSAAITRHPFGKGSAFYVGTLPNAQGLDWWVGHLCDELGLRANRQPGVEVVRRVNGDASWTFLLNHSAEKVHIALEGSGLDLLTGAQTSNTVQLEPNGVAVIQMENQ